MEPMNHTFNKRIMELLAEESKQPMGWWYITFAGEDGFLGAVYLEARGMTGAMYISKQRGINPGGEVRGIPVPSDIVLKPEYCYRLLKTQEEINAAVM